MKYLNKTVWLSLLIKRFRRDKIPRKGSRVWGTFVEAENHRIELEKQGYWVAILHVGNSSKIDGYNVIWVMDRKDNAALPDGYSNVKGQHQTIYPDE